MVVHISVLLVELHVEPDVHLIDAPGVGVKMATAAPGLQRVRAADADEQRSLAGRGGVAIRHEFHVCGRDPSIAPPGTDVLEAPRLEVLDEEDARIALEALVAGVERRRP
jgi:hypothetical protein